MNVYRARFLIKRSIMFRRLASKYSAHIVPRANCFGGWMFGIIWRAFSAHFLQGGKFLPSATRLIKSASIIEKRKCRAVVGETQDTSPETTGPSREVVAAPVVSIGTVSGRKSQPLKLYNTVTAFAVSVRPPHHQSVPSYSYPVVHAWALNCEHEKNGLSNRLHWKKHSRRTIGIH